MILNNGDKILSNITTPASTLLNDLQAYYKLDSNINDSTGNFNLSAGIGTVTYQAGKINNCGNFAGGDRCDYGSSPVTGTSDFTISAWVNIPLANIGAFKGLVGFGNGVSNEGFFFAISPLGKVVMDIYGVGGQLIANTNIANGTWRHIVGVKTGGTFQVYVDGVADNTPFVHTTLNLGNSYFYLGNVYNGGPAYNELADEIAVWDRALTTDEIAELYNAGSGNTHPFAISRPIILNHLNQRPEYVQDGLELHLNAADTDSYSGSGSTWYDLTANNRDATLINSPTYSLTPTHPNIYFNRATQQVAEINSSGTLAGEDFTFSVFVNFPTFVNARYFATKGYNLGWGTYWFILDPAGNLQCGIGTSIFYYYSGVTTLELNRWYMLSVTYSSNTAKLYINGVLTITWNTVGTIRTNSTNITLARYAAFYNGAYTTCRFNDVSYYSRALTEAEIKRNYRYLT